MNIKSARDISLVITEQREWKNRIQAQIDNHSYDAKSISEMIIDDKCFLGQWIHGEGEKTLSGDCDFIALKLVHTHLHDLAGRALEMATNGQVDAAKNLISKGEFSIISNNISSLLTTLYKRYK